MREDAPDPNETPTAADGPVPVAGADAGGAVEPTDPVDADGGSATRGRDEPPAGGDAARAPAGEGGDGERTTTAGGAGDDGGHVSLVGAGPGDPDLLTRRAWQRLRAADVVLYDSLAGDDILADLPAGVETVDVGKRPPNRTTQAEINDLMAARAGRGERVVRLKGGDPNVFGRGGEEAEHLASEGVAFEVVPGVSSVLAAPSTAGIPLTHRDCSSSLTVITGHQTPDKAESAIDWPAIADSIAAGGTLVVLMGVSKLPDNVAALREHGVAADTPVAMVEKATWDGERTVTGTLADIEARSDSAGIEPPAVTIVGEVVGVRDDVADCLR